MRLLADENFPISIVQSLREDGHDVLWARTELSGWKDTALLDFAEVKARIMLTLDKDFWQIAVQRQPPLQRSGVVLFRVHPATAENLQPPPPESRCLLYEGVDDRVPYWGTRFLVVGKWLKTRSSFRKAQDR